MPSVPFRGFRLQVCPVYFYEPVPGRISKISKHNLQYFKCIRKRLDWPWSWTSLVWIASPSEKTETSSLWCCSATCGRYLSEADVAGCYHRPCYVRIWYVGRWPTVTLRSMGVWSALLPSDGHQKALLIFWRSDRSGRPYKRLIPVSPRRLATKPFGEEGFWGPTAPSISGEKISGAILPSLFSSLSLSVALWLFRVISF